MLSRLAVSLRGNGSTSERAPRIAAIALLAAVCVGGFEPFYLRIFLMDRPRFVAAMASLQYRKEPGLAGFLQGARTRTPKGAKIALVVSSMQWPEYEYVLSRSNYTLAGRDVIPLLDEDGIRHMDRAGVAQYLMVWKTTVPAGFAPVWSEGMGTLARRSRP